MATQSKAQYLTDLQTLLKKRYKPKAEASSARLTILEAIVYGICHEDTTGEQASQALTRFKSDFFDWNEVRVSSLEEIQVPLAGFPNSDDRAFRIRRFLRQLFEKTYAFNLEALTKKPLKESVKALQEYEVLGSDYVTATVIQMALGGHAIPVDESVRRALERLGVVDPDTDAAATRSLLERAVPKNRGLEFAELLEELAHDTCVEGIPDCPRCEVQKTCPTGQARKEEALHAKSAGATAKAPKDEGKGAKSTASAKAAPVDPAPASADSGASKPAKGKPGRSK